MIDYMDEYINFSDREEKLKFYMPKPIWEGVLKAFEYPVNAKDVVDVARQKSAIKNFLKWLKGYEISVATEYQIIPTRLRLNEFLKDKLFKSIKCLKRKRFYFDVKLVCRDVNGEIIPIKELDVVKTFDQNEKENYLSITAYSAKVLIITHVTFSQALELRKKILEKAEEEYNIKFDFKKLDEELGKVIDAYGGMFNYEKVGDMKKEFANEINRILRKYNIRSDRSLTFPVPNYLNGFVSDVFRIINLQQFFPYAFIKSIIEDETISVLTGKFGHKIKNDCQQFIKNFEKTLFRIFEDFIEVYLNVSEELEKYAKVDLKKLEKSLDFLSS